MHHARKLSRTPQFARFLIPRTISNRDMSELMTRDTEFEKSSVQAHRSFHNGPPIEEGGDVQTPLNSQSRGVETGKLYESLCEKDQFRLLEILPGTADATLRCRLHVCCMRDNRNSYEALSYCWGGRLSPDQYPKIECNGFEMAVGVNLHLALRRLRRQDSIRVVWADAICINQGDSIERSRQVAMMGEIFKNASRVIVWLGTQPRDQEADETSRAFGGVCSIVQVWATEQGLDIERPYFRTQESAKHLYGDGPMSLESLARDTASTLYDIRWFERLWVVQEIALARAATVFWGSSEISWEWIGLAAAIIRTNWHRILPHFLDQHKYCASDRQVPVGVMNAYFMYRISNSQRYFEPLRFSFCELLTLTRQFQCQDMRDQIFGVLGLETTDGVNSAITPDYTKPLAEVYRHVAIAMLHSKDPLAVLSHVHHTDLDEHGYEEPIIIPDQDSWVPNWDMKGPQSLRPLDGHPEFAAGLLKPAWIRDSVKDNAYGKLVVRGAIISDVRRKFWLKRELLEREDDGQRPVLLQGISGFTQADLERLALTLTGGKTWYGTPNTNRTSLLADFANCLVNGYLLWALEMNNISESLSAADTMTIATLGEMAQSGDKDLFMDAVATTCVGRCLFSTESTMLGIGPYGTEQGDTVCVIYGSATPFVIRPRE
ncbi:hypothetical protein FSARC_14229, partial [Fusarium sarcochroum]